MKKICVSLVDNDRIAIFSKVNFKHYREYKYISDLRDILCL